MYLSLNSLNMKLTEAKILCVKNSLSKVHVFIKDRYSHNDTYLYNNTYVNGSKLK